MKYEFKYRLSQKSSFAAIAKAVRALGMEMKIEKRGVTISWMEKANQPTALTQELYKSNTMLDERVPEWLNGKLEEHELLAPKELEP